MSKHIHFLGWDKPVADTVARRVLGAITPPLVRLDKLLIVTPTREAGRRLREKMAVLCHANQAALLGARIVTPLFLTQPHETAGKVAGQALLKSAWLKTLRSLRPDDCRGLFPRGIPANNANWVFDTARIIQQLRADLSDAGFSIKSVLEKHAADLQEIERWQDLARLEEIYLANLEQTGLLDPCAARLAAAKSPVLPGDIEKIVIAAVPDFPLLVLAALEALSKKIKIEILVMAPADRQDYFDPWGRPLPDKWRQYRIDIPDPKKNIRIAGNPAAQARAITGLIRAAGYQLADICIGVPDREVIPHLQNCLENAGITAFDPADRPVKDHHLYHLIQAWRKLVEDGSFASLAGWLHEADILECLREEYGLHPPELLAELDRLQNNALPQTMRDVEFALKKHGISMNRAAASRPHYPNLKQAFEFALEITAAANAQPREEALREFLQRIFAVKVLAGNSEADADFKAVAALIADILNEISYARPGLAKHQPRVVAQLITGALDELSIPRRREGALIDLNGWLELAWNDAALMIISGFNEGLVPDSRKSDIFLPDALKKMLGLRNDETRFARDAYLLALILATRARDGRVILMAGKTSAAGDPLKPSRLLFRCPDGQLPERTAFIFGELDAEIHNPPFSVSFKLDPAAPLVLNVPREARQQSPLPTGETPPSAGVQIPRPHFMPAELRVTQLRDYLACPFRFFLKHILKMERTEFKAELDARDFGTALHVILEKFAGNPEISRATDAGAIQKHLAGLRDEYFQRVFGANDSFAIRYARDIAGQRLGAFARLQAQSAAEGWEIAAHELSGRMEIAGIAVSGKIDRIDVHRPDGKMRIIDYKTSETAIPPAKAHLKKARKEIPDFARHGHAEQWIDLQLPLYWHLFKRAEGVQKSGEIELCYFNLPMAVSGAGIETWEGFDDSLANSALKTAAEIIQRIKSGNFWPPAESITHDDFASLHNEDIKDYFEGEKIIEYFTANNAIDAKAKDEIRP